MLAKKTAEATEKKNAALKKRPAAKAAPKKDTASPTKLAMAVERSRKQVMLRNGQSGPGTTFKMKFADHGGEGKAVKKARKWLEAEQKSYTDTFDMVM